MRQHDRSWLKLIAYPALSTLASSLLFAAVLASVTLAIAAGEPPHAPDEQPADPAVPAQIFSGIITDSHCRSRHTDPQKSASECVRMCVGNGSTYMIANGDKEYALAGNLEQVGQLAGQRVSLVGVLKENIINVSSVITETANACR